MAIIIPEPLQSEITHIKLNIFHATGSKAALKSPAHITLIPPFQCDVVLEPELKHFTSAYNNKINSFVITLKGFGHFGKRTIFIIVEKNDCLNHLHSSINEQFGQTNFMNLKSKAHLQQSPLFTPHITVVNRDINPAQFDRLWMQYGQQEYNNYFTLHSVHLLKHNGSNWDVL